MSAPDSSKGGHCSLTLLPGSSGAPGFALETGEVPGSLCRVFYSRSSKLIVSFRGSAIPGSSDGPATGSCEMLGPPLEMV